jgi:arsenate reductase
MRNAIFHNPRCSKSRQALALLQEQSVELETVLYLDTPLDAAELRDVFQTLGKDPLAVMRTQEARFAELGLSTSDERSPAEWIELIIANPVLLERPIVCFNGKAAIGRPPENVLTIL